MAEAAFRRELARLDLELCVDSAGTGDWHVGKPPDPRAQSEAALHGIDISKYRARQIEADDFMRFSYILALDHQNLEDLKAIVPANSRAVLSLMLDHVDGMEGLAVADPYFGDADGFSQTWKEVSLAARALAEKFS